MAKECEEEKRDGGRDVAEDRRWRFLELLELIRINEETWGPGKGVRFTSLSAPKFRVEERKQGNKKERREGSSVVSRVRRRREATKQKRRPVERYTESPGCGRV